jgi:hypothetical protein
MMRAVLSAPFADATPSNSRQRISNLDDMKHKLRE